PAAVQADVGAPGAHYEPRPAFRVAAPEQQGGRAAVAGERPCSACAELECVPVEWGCLPLAGRVLEPHVGQAPSYVPVLALCRYMQTGQYCASRPLSRGGWALRVTRLCRPARREDNAAQGGRGGRWRLEVRPGSEGRA